MSRIFLLCLFLLMLSGSFSDAFDKKIAVFPLEDLSVSSNAINLPVTARIIDELSHNGFEVCPFDKIISFMVRDKIRWVGYLDTYHILQAGKELGVDFIILGTITQSKNDPYPSFGIALNFIRTSDAKNIYSEVYSAATYELHRVLGISEPKSREDLLRLIMNRITSVCSSERDVGKSDGTLFELSHVSLEPRYAKVGEKVTCTVRIRSVKDEPAPSLLLRVGSDMVLPMNRLKEDTYEASWVIGEKEGVYSVTLVIQRPSGEPREFFVGSYHIDLAAPQFVLDINSGVKVNDVPAFKDEILIKPHFIKGKPVTRWSFSISDESEKQIFYEEKMDALPSDFVWKGVNNSGAPVPDGVYKVMVKIWDKTQNEAVARNKVALIRTPPYLLIDIKKKDNGIMLNLTKKGVAPLAFWRMEIRDKVNGLIKTEEGDELPAEVMLSPEEVGGFVLTAKDVLGNLFRQEIKEFGPWLKGYGKIKEMTDNRPAGWVEDF